MAKKVEVDSWLSRRRFVGPRGEVFYRLTERELRMVTASPRWMRWLLYVSPFAGVACAQILLWIAKG